MSELRGIYALWLREVKRYSRERTRLVSSLTQPLLWLVIFGTGLGSAIGIPGLNYQQFIFPGIIGQTMLFTAMFMGISVIWDRQFGFMKEILVAPVSRISIFMGKVLGVATDSLIQGIIIFAFGFLLAAPLHLSLEPSMFFKSIPVMVIITIGLVCIGLTLASLMNNLENFGAIMTFVNLPMFFLSGALFPVTRIPEWLKWAFYVNPLTYGVDTLRSIMLGSGWETILPLYYEVSIIIIFDIVMVIIGTYAFSRTQ
ncbi:ABC transporter permease [Methanocella conradii]|uniref:ABC transporter permease n=1 Tax=Methanocella conradii TaxID=1175444 RepID=UPI00157C3C2D|nr:ABC transporter permease [Methanocella conradii]